MSQLNGEGALWLCATFIFNDAAQRLYAQYDLFIGESFA